MNRLILMLFLFAFELLSCNGQSRQVNYSTINDKSVKRYKAWDSPAPYFKVKDYQGTNISLNKCRGEWILLYFWSSKSDWSWNGLAEIEKASLKYNRMVTFCLFCYETKKEW